MRMRESMGLTQAAMAERLGVTQSWVSRFEGGSQTPERAAIIRVGESLRFDPRQINRLLSAARVEAGDSMHYEPLEPATNSDESSALQGFDVENWLTRLEHIEKASVHSGVTVVADEAPDLLDEIWGANDLLLNPKLRRIATRVWLRACFQLMDAWALLLGTDHFRLVFQRYVDQVRKLLRTTSDAESTALGFLIEGGHWHMVGDAHRATTLAFKARPGLSDPLQRCLAQRMVILEYPFLRSPYYDIDEEMKIGRAFAESVDDRDVRPRTRMLEAMAATEGRLGDSTCWGDLATVKNEAEGHDLIASVAAIRSEMVAVASDPYGVDRERLSDLHTEGRSLTRRLGWKHREESLDAIIAE